jgi:hypothetical protein
VIGIYPATDSIPAMTPLQVAPIDSGAFRGTPEVVMRRLVPVVG